MEFFVGLDVSLDETHICVVDEGGRIIKETRSQSEPQAIAKAIRHKGRRIEHVGLETGNLSQWLYEGLVKEGFSVSVMEARHVRAAFAAMRVKTDRNDARGLAQLIRLGWFKRAHVKSLDAQETRALLTARTFLIEKIGATENSLRAALRNFGLKMGSVTRKTWEPRARELADGNELLEGIVDAMLRIRTLLREELARIDGQLAALAKSDPVTRLLMTTPGVGVVVALSFRSAVDDPNRFPRSRDVGAWLGFAAGASSPRYRLGASHLPQSASCGGVPTTDRSMDLLVGQTHLTEIARSQKRQVIGIFVHQHMRQQARTRAAPFDRARRQRCLCERLAARACKAWPHDAVHDEATGDIFQFFGWFILRLFVGKTQLCRHLCDSDLAGLQCQLKLLNALR